MSSENNTTITITVPTMFKLMSLLIMPIIIMSTHREWTVEFDIALLEDVGNCGAHILGHDQTTKSFEAVPEALKARSMPFDSAQTIQCCWVHLKGKYIKKMASKKRRQLAQKTLGMMKMIHSVS